MTASVEIVKRKIRRGERGECACTLVGADAEPCAALVWVERERATENGSELREIDSIAREQIVRRRHAEPIAAETVLGDVPSECRMDVSSVYGDVAVAGRDVDVDGAAVVDDREASQNETDYTRRSARLHEKVRADSRPKYKAYKTDYCCFRT
jgi:hypothetical protein